MKITNKILLALLFLFAFFGMAVTTQAEVRVAEEPSLCTDLPSSLRYGMSGLNVTALQNFLHNEGFLTVNPTGYFGAATFAAVKSFQSSLGWTPTGYVGALTRASIKSLTCSDGASNALTTDAPPATLTATSISPTYIPAAGGYSVLSFSTTNVSSCTLAKAISTGSNVLFRGKIDGVPGTAVAVNGPVTMGPFSAGTWVVYLYCTGTNGVGISYRGALVSGEITATAPITYTVSATAGAGGTITPASRIVSSGNTTTFDVIPNPNHTTSAIGCAGKLSGTTYTTGTITGNCTVSASFYNTLTVPAPAGVTTAGTTPTSYTYTWTDRNAVTTANYPAGTRLYPPLETTRTGYTFAGWSPASPTTMPVGGGASTAQWTSVTAPTVTTPTVYTSSNSDNNICRVPVGSRSCTINVSWQVSNITTPLMLYERTRVPGQPSTFSVDSHELGVVSWAGNHSFTLTPADYGKNFYLRTGTPLVVLNDTTQNSLQALCATGSTWNGTLCSAPGTTATTAPITYTVSATAGAGGTITPASRIVSSGNTTTFDVIPNPNHIASAIGCAGKLSGTTYTTGTITGNCTVSASFYNTLTVPAPVTTTAPTVTFSGSPTTTSLPTVTSVGVYPASTPSSYNWNFTISWSGTNAATYYLKTNNGAEVYMGTAMQLVRTIAANGLHPQLGKGTHTFSVKGCNVSGGGCSAWSTPATLIVY